MQISRIGLRRGKELGVSVGWIAMTSSNGSLFSPFVPQQTYEHIYQNGPDVIFAGATQPAGTAEEAGAGGRLVNGRWPFASGCRNADWIAGFCVSISNGKPVCTENLSSDGLLTMVDGEVIFEDALWTSRP